jgi:hypothetical protein
MQIHLCTSLILQCIALSATSGHRGAVSREITAPFAMSTLRRPSTSSSEHQLMPFFVSLPELQRLQLQRLRISPPREIVEFNPRVSLFSTSAKLMGSRLRHFMCEAGGESSNPASFDGGDESKRDLSIPDRSGYDKNGLRQFIQVLLHCIFAKESNQSHAQTQ